MFTYEYPRPAVAVDLIVVAEKDDMTKILFIRRGKEPFKGKLAFPGGYLNIDEAGIDGAVREFKEECCAELPAGNPPVLLCVADGVDRDPRGRVISLVYFLAYTGDPFEVKGGDDAAEALWIPINEIDVNELAFDHGKIMEEFFLRLMK